MADEISQVQQTGVNPLWPITGAVVGGGVTYEGLRRTGYASAPYSSHADLVKETNEKDKVELNKKTVKGEAQENALKTAEDKFKAAEAKYDADLKAYQEANAGAKTAELPENHDAMKNLKKAQEDLEAKKNQLIDEKLKNISPEQQARLEELKKRQASIYKPRKAAVDKINAEIPKFAEELKALEARRQAILNAPEAQKLKHVLYKLNLENAKGAEANIGVKLNLFKQKKKLSPIEEQINTLFSDYAKLNERITGLANNEALGFGKDAEAKKQFIKEIQEAVRTSVAREEAKIPLEVSKELAERQANIDKATAEVAGKYNKAFEEFTAKKAGIFEEIKSAAANNDKKAVEDAIAKLTPQEQEIVNKYFDKNGKLSASNIDKAANEVARRMDDNITAMVVKNQEKQSAKEAEKLNTIYEKIQTAFNKNDQKAVNEAFNELKAANPEYAAKLEEVYAKNHSAEGLKAAIAEVKADQAKKLADFKKAVADIDALKAEVEQIAGKGARLQTVDGVARFVDADGNVITNKLTREQSRNLRTRVSVPEFGKLKALNERIAELTGSGATREEIAAALQESEYAKELEAVRNAENAVTEARNALPKVEAKTPEQLAEEFAKTNGTKKEAITKALKESEAELKPLFEKKWGNGKVAGAVAAGAAAVGFLAYLMAPKGDRA